MVVGRSSRTFVRYLFSNSCISHCKSLSVPLEVKSSPCTTSRMPLSLCQKVHGEVVLRRNPMDSSIRTYSCSLSCPVQRLAQAATASWHCISTCNTIRSARKRRLLPVARCPNFQEPKVNWLTYSLTVFPSESGVTCMCITRLMTTHVKELILISMHIFRIEESLVYIKRWAIDGAVKNKPLSRHPLASVVLVRVPSADSHDTQCSNNTVGFVMNVCPTQTVTSNPASLETSPELQKFWMVGRITLSKVRVRCGTEVVKSKIRFALMHLLHFVVAD